MESVGVLTSSQVSFMQCEVLQEGHDVWWRRSAIVATLRAVTTDHNPHTCPAGLAWKWSVGRAPLCQPSRAWRLALIKKEIVSKS